MDEQNVITNQAEDNELEDSVKDLFDADTESNEDSSVDDEQIDDPINEDDDEDVGDEDADLEDDSFFGDGDDADPGDEDNESDADSEEDTPGDTGEDSGEPPADVADGDVAAPEDLADVDLPANDRDVFKPEYIPGEPEYFDRLSAETKAIVAAKLGEEFDELDPKHMAAFNHFFAKADQQNTSRFTKAKQELAQEQKATRLKQTFDAELRKILPTQQLQEKFVQAVEGMSLRDYKKAKADVLKGDFAAFRKIASSIVGAKRNLDAVNSRNKKESSEGPKAGSSSGKKLASDLFGD